MAPGARGLFLLMAGIGLDAKIVYNISLPLKARLGKLAYWIGGFGLVGRKLDEFEVLVEGRRVNCAFALISKVRNYGGDLEIAQTSACSTIVSKWCCSKDAVRSAF